MRKAIPDSVRALSAGGGLAAGALVLCVGLLGPLLGSSVAAASPAGSARVALLGEVPKVPAGTTRLGSVPGAQSLQLELSLAGQNPGGLAAEVAAVSTPGSPTYHHYLTTAQFETAYGPSSPEVQQVTTTLRSEGLTVGTPDAGSNLLPVSGRAALVSSLLHTPLESVRLPGHVASMVNTAAPEIPATLAGEITGIIGLSGLAREHSSLRRAVGRSGRSSSGSVAHTASASGGSSSTSTAAVVIGGVTTDPSVIDPSTPSNEPQACSAASTAAAAGNGYTSTQLEEDYGLSQLFAQGRTGLGQTIALVEFEQFSMADVDTFEACYGLHNPVQVVTVDQAPSGSVSGSGEAALDVELAAVNAPSASIDVYEAPNETTDGTALDIFNRIASDDLAQVVTTSWGECEANDMPTAALAEENTVFERMAVQGQTMVAASGDEGSEDCYNPYVAPSATQLAVDDPGSQPDVLSVGGTTLVNGAVASQVAWNDCAEQAKGDCQLFGGNGAGGGGVSTDWTKPTWQTSGTTGRAVPDLSSSADPAHGVSFYFAKDGGWSSIGGTSVVAPEMGGFLADVNQGCSSTSGLLGPALYAADASNGANFTDVTNGNNDFTETENGTYAAAAGYDEATGLGTPVDPTLAIALEGADGCPSVGALSAYSGPAAGSGAITIAGGGLADASAVTFGAAGAGTIVSRSETSLVVVPPSPRQALCVDVTVTNPLGTSQSSEADLFGFGSSGSCNGYRFVASDGGIFDFGSAAYEGSTGNLALQAPIVGMATTPDGNGYWLVAADGGIFTFGDAAFYGSTGSVHLNQPVVGMAATPDGKGYWLVAADGGIFTFGDAGYFGSTGSLHLNQPVVGMAAAPDGGGYWLVAADGGIFTYGDATYFGSAGSMVLAKPIVGMAATPDSKGYWLVAADGGVFTYGDARFFGSTGGTSLNQPIVSLAAG